jgi:peptidoglycan/xylan/chitin deacetylase (PgdA/CDA1 family)
LRIPGAKAARQFTRWLSSRFTGGALILGYHRVAHDVHDPYGLCVKPHHFREQMSVLASRANPISLEQLGEALLRGDCPSRPVVITFDDGYLDNLENALPVLTDYRIPATFFVVTGNLGRPFWWDELAELIPSDSEGLQRLALEAAGFFATQLSIQNSGSANRQTDQTRKRLLLEVYHLLLTARPGERQSFLDQLKVAAEDRPTTRLNTTRAMSSIELRQLAQSDLTAIGSHTHNHPILPKLPPEEQRNEILNSKACLEELLCRPVTSFSYPNSQGSELTRLIMRECDVVLACGGSNDLVRPGSDPLFLPRFWIPDWDGKRFSRWLNTWLVDRTC